MAISILKHPPPQLQTHSAPLENLPKTLFLPLFWDRVSRNPGWPWNVLHNRTIMLLDYKTSNLSIKRTRKIEEKTPNKQKRKKERQRRVPRLYLHSNPLNVQITLDRDKEKQQSNKQQEPSAAGERVFSSNTPENSVKKFCSPLSGYSYLKSKFHEGCRLNLINFGQTR